MRMRGRGFTSGPTTRMGPAGRSAARISASGQWGAGEDEGAEKTGRPPGSKKSTSAREAHVEDHSRRERGDRASRSAPSIWGRTARKPQRAWARARSWTSVW